MNVKIIIVILCITSLFQLKAQNTKNKQSFYVQSGLVNGLAGYDVGAGFEKLFGNHSNNGLDVGFNYQDIDNSYSSANMIINEKSYFVNISYRRYFELSTLNQFYPYASLGVLGGLTTLNKKNNGIFHLKRQNDVLYGIISTIGVEYKYEKIHPFIEGGYYFTGDHFFRFNLGLKYIF